MGLLDFIASRAKRYPCFRLLMSTEADGLIVEQVRVVGITAKTADGALTIRAGLTIGADGRHSLIREEAGFDPLEIGAPMDVLWFRLSRNDADPQETFGRIEAGQMLVLINRGEHWQCGYVIAKDPPTGSSARHREAPREYRGAGSVLGVRPSNSGALMMSSF